MRERNAVIPYYNVKKGRGYWQPTKEMRALGAQSVPCGDDGYDARQKAINCNAAWAQRKDVSDFVQAFKRVKPKANPEDRGFVYFVRSRDFIKIGFTTKPHQRLAELKTGHPGEFASILVVEGERQHENLLHQLLGRYRFSGEWFRATATVLNAMAQCMRAGRVEIGTNLGINSEQTPDKRFEENFQERQFSPLI